MINVASAEPQSLSPGPSMDLTEGSVPTDNTEEIPVEWLTALNNHFKIKSCWRRRQCFGIPQWFQRPYWNKDQHSSQILQKGLEFEELDETEISEWVHRSDFAGHKLMVQSLSEVGSDQNNKEGKKTDSLDASHGRSMLPDTSLSRPEKVQQGIKSVPPVDML